MRSPILNRELISPHVSVDRLHAISRASQFCEQFRTSFQVETQRNFETDQRLIIRRAAKVVNGTGLAFGG